MDFETAIRSLSAYLGKTDNAMSLLYAVIVAAITVVVKKIVGKRKVKLPHKTDALELLPFAFAPIFAAVNLFLVEKPLGLTIYQTIVKIVGDGVVIGAMATVICGFIASADGNSVQNLMKNDAFAVVYTQLLYCGGVKERLNKGELSLSEFLQEAKTLAGKLSAMYGSGATGDDRKQKLFAAVAEFVGSDDVGVLADALDAAFSKLSEK